MNIKTKGKLGFKMTAYCIVFALCLTFIIGGIGVYTYYENSMEHYKSFLYSIVAITKQILNKDELEKTIKYDELNQSYYELQYYLDSIKDYGNIEYIYIMDQNENADYEYIICGYSKEELKTPDIQLKFKDIVADEIDSKMMAVFKEVITGENDNIFVLNNSDLGYVMTLVTSIQNSTGEIIGVLAADILVDHIMQDVRNYIVTVLMWTVLAMIVFLLFFIIRIRKTIIKPIISIGKYANDFVGQTNLEPSQIHIKEMNIRTGDELELLSKQLNTMMKDMVEYMQGLESMTAQHERMNMQLELTRQIQQNMLPGKFPAFPERIEFDIHAIMKPSGDVGGEFYDFFLTDGTHLGIITASVVGEGIPAALFMMRCKTLMKNYAVLGLEPAKVLAETNNELCKSNSAGLLLEVFIGILDVYSGEFVYANAGEHKPYVIAEDGEIKQIETAEGFLLGTMEYIPFYQNTINLHKKDILCLFTRGFFNIVNRKGKMQVSDLLLRINSNLTLNSSMKELADLAEEEINQICGKVREYDLTLVAVRFEGYMV